MDPRLQEVFDMSTHSPLELESKAAFTELAAKFDSLVTAIAEQYGVCESTVAFLICAALRQPRTEANTP